MRRQRSPRTATALELRAAPRASDSAKTAQRFARSALPLQRMETCCRSLWHRYSRCSHNRHEKAQKCTKNSRSAAAPTYTISHLEVHIAALFLCHFVPFCGPTLHFDESDESRGVNAL